MNLPSRENVISLVDKYASSTKQHLLQVWDIMEYFASKLWEDKHYWWIVWVLHDIDWDFVEKDWDRHLKDDLEIIVSEIDLHPEMIADIRAHWHFLDWIEEKPDTLIRKYLVATDELSWFIWAYFRMIPSNDVMDIKASSIVKKLKDKGFAAWVDRNEAKACESLLDIPVLDFIEDIKLALSSKWHKK